MKDYRCYLNMTKEEVEDDAVKSIHELCSNEKLTQREAMDEVNEIMFYALLSQGMGRLASNFTFFTDWYLKL